MLEELDTVDWASLQDTSGPAAQLPDIIRALGSGEESAQKEAQHDLYERVWYYGRYSQATPHVIPFLIELLALDAVQDRVGILTMLYYLSDGPTPWAREPTNLKTYGESQEGESLVLLHSEENLTRLEIDEVFKQEQVYIKQSHDAVREGLPIYLRLLETDPDPYVREICGWLAVTFPEKVDEIAPHLRARIPHEEEIGVRVTLIWSLGRLAGGQKDDIPLFASLARSPSHPLIYFYAASALTSIAGDETPDDIVALVITGIYWEDWGYPPFIIETPLPSDMVRHACRALSKLGPTRSVLALSAALRRMKSKYGLYDLLEILLDLAFGGKKRPMGGRALTWTENGVSVSGRKYEEMPQDKETAVRKLTYLQRQAVAAIVEKDLLWQRFNNMYILYGLPATRDGLRDLLMKSG